MFPFADARLVFEVVRLSKSDGTPTRGEDVEVVGAVPGRGGVLALRPNPKALAIEEAVVDGGEDGALSTLD